MYGKSLVNTDGRIICIGDLHGCFEEAVELLDLCKVTAKDTVVFLGDTIDRGPHNDKCVDLAMKHECILGNHEDKHMSYIHLERAGKDPKIVAPTHIATRAQLRREHFDYFERLPYYIRFPQYNAVAVHAGCFPNIPIEGQNPHHLLHIQMINPEAGKESKWPSKAPEGWKSWVSYWTGPEKVIFGHSVFDKPLVTEHAVGIDGGAVFGRSLWAYSMPDNKIYEVSGKQNYGRGVRGRPSEDELLRGAKIQTYPFFADVNSFS
jgi:hypothetical protein